MRTWSDLAVPWVAGPRFLLLAATLLLPVSVLLGHPRRALRLKNLRGKPTTALRREGRGPWLIPRGLGWDPLKVPAVLAADSLPLQPVVPALNCSYPFLRLKRGVKKLAMSQLLLLLPELA